MSETTGIWSLHEAQMHHRHDPKLAIAIADILDKNELIYDIGCGLGKYCISLTEAGFNVIGFEGTEGMTEFGDYENIVECDFTKVDHFPSFGQTICLEVGEHIPPRFEKHFIDLIAHSTTTRAIISWAVPGQGGQGHVNERPNSAISHHMHRNSFYLNPELTLSLRKAAQLPWFINTLMVFDHYE